MSEAAQTIGVVGAGTMGAGIAQLACRSGARTLLHDPFPDALASGAEKVHAGLGKEAAKGRLSAAQATAAGSLLEPVDSLDALALCDLVIEAAPERLDVKHELYARLSKIVKDDCVLASNTSSLPITAIAAGATCPERVVGMHFFNPAPVMRLLEVIAGVLSDERSLTLAHATGEAMGKDVIRAADGPGFIVNRCNRPFGLEALRLLAEGIADTATIDRVVRMGGGFKMGPFELSDLVGVDTGFDVSKSFYELSFGEPRWRPSSIQALRVAAGLHGRKSGRGYYDYGGDGHYRPTDPGQPTPPPLVAQETVVVIGGNTPLCSQLREAASAAGFDVRSPAEPQTELPALVVECGDVEDKEHGESKGESHAARPARGGPRLVLCDRGSLATLDPDGPAVGFHALPPFADCKLVELTRNDSSSPAAASRAERFFAALGKHVEWVGDAPGLVLGRIVCQVINESAFALGEGVGSAQDIDTGMVLGLAHPRGPFAWAQQIGLEHVRAVLDGLWSEYREERYRMAPALRRGELLEP
ncbi:MAG TPA: 3-hydroxyacyl-CoA dehydrogenase NAD-binding domain-containing protein [Solirubrobacteraceae bacterium]|nr:3-hydroxyacyl-CoA dehydrogenase NAD-binding domain-containing protein [Solirubrobacteraceae bacterium]